MDRLACWSHPPVAEFQYGKWLRDEYESGHVPQRGIAADLTILLDPARRRGTALVGPSAATVLPEIPENDLVAASIAGIDGLLDDLEGDERNVLLTFARMLVTAETGEVIPKDAAAEAVCDRVADAGLLEAAAADYRGQPSLEWSEYTDEVRACVQQLIQAVQLVE
jgi:aminoglycoside 9-adenylyltransferase